jgi:HEAT repeat protein
MLTLTRIAADVAWPFAASLFVLASALVAAICLRRIGRRRYFSRLDRARSELAFVLEELGARRITYQQALARLRPFTAPRLRRSFEAVLMAGDCPASREPALVAALCEDLGLIDRWTAVLSSGPRTRARGHLSSRAGSSGSGRREHAAGLLAAVRHRGSWPALADALHDPHPGVRAAAARALAQIQELACVSALAASLERAVLNSGRDGSLQAVKMALVCFPPASIGPLESLLVHDEPRVRQVAVEVLAALIERARASQPGATSANAEFPPGIENLFVTRLVADHSPEVRARAADVVGRFAPHAALPPLLRLARDSEWFVRLHAVRALGGQAVTPLAALRERLVDRHWRVREAAAQALSSVGVRGVQALLDHFLSTADPYSREQVAEQLDRAGLVPSCVELLRGPGPGREAEFARAFAESGHAKIDRFALRKQRSGAS